MKPNQQATVYPLLERGNTQREIACITGIDRKTDRSYQRRWLAEISNSPGWPPARMTLPGDAGGVSQALPCRATFTPYLYKFQV
ncbi:MAG TPA: hypothetical protein PK347_05650 [Burkholderiaceae bacterium]|nr:hypothetical protein [Burkholderiaceae bacterium]